METITKFGFLKMSTDSKPLHFFIPPELLSVVVVELRIFTAKLVQLSHLVVFLIVLLL